MKSIIISAIIGIMFLLFASSGANAQQYVGITPYLPAEPTNYTSSVNVSTGYFTNITNDVLTGNMSMIVDNVTGGQFEGDLLAPVVDSVGGPGNFWFFFFGIIILYVFWVTKEVLVAVALGIVLGMVMWSMIPGAYYQGITFVIIAAITAVIYYAILSTRKT